MTMGSSPCPRPSLWTSVAPIAAFVLLVVIWDVPLSGVVNFLVLIVLGAAVFAAVHHAEVVARRTGEPFGTLILALAVTVIEVSLIVALMLSGGPGAATLARDTVFATVMIVCNGVVALCLLTGGLRHHVVTFRVEGSGSALSVLGALTVLTLVLPTFTTSTPDPTFSKPQLAFAGIMSLLLYAVFIFVQTVRHRDHFLQEGGGIEDPFSGRPSVTLTAISFALLALSLVCVVGLAKSLAPAIRQSLAAAAIPDAVVGIAIALLVLMPETLAAVRAAARNRVQTSLNLALGSGLATIGLTIPAVAAVSMLENIPLQLGLPAKETTLLALTLLTSAITFGGGQATVLQGAVHLVIFGAFLFLAVVP